MIPYKRDYPRHGPANPVAVLLLSLVSLPLGAQDAPGAARLDWVLREDLPAELLDQCPRSCTGMYVEPARSYPGIDTPPNEANIEVISDLSEVVGDEGVAVMQGAVELTQGWRSVEAQQVTILQEQSRMELSGNIRLREPGLLITGGSASIDSTTEALRFDDAEFVMHNLGARGTAEEIGRDEEGRFYVINATYSTCEPGAKGWSLSASEIRIDSEELFATVRNMTVRAGNIPIFYAPIFAFPVGEGRKTGLLYPVMSRSSDNGLDYTQSIYLNLAPHYDATISPRLIEKRGAALELESRYLGANSYQEIATSFLPNDDGGDSNRQQGQDRWFFKYQQQGEWLWGHTVFDYNQVSDTNYFEDLGAATLEARNETHLRQQAYWQQLYPNWTLRGEVLRYQTLAEDLAKPYRELPRLEANGLYRQWGLEWALDHQWVDFEHPDDQLVASAPFLQADQKGTWITGSRSAVDYRIGKSLAAPWGPFQADLFNHYRSYQLDAPLAGYSSATPDADASGFRLSTSMQLERQMRLFGQQWIQTLEPRIQYLSVQASSQTDVPIFDTRNASESYQSLFRENRFIGGDRLGDANQVSVGVSTRFSRPQGGPDLATFNLGQSFYLEDRKVHASELLQQNLGDPSLYAIDDPLRLLAEESDQLRRQLTSDQSNLIAEADIQVNSEWQLTADSHFNMRDGQMEQGHLNLSYLASDQLSAMSLAYRYRSDVSLFVDRNDDNLVQAGELLAGNTHQYDLAGMYALDEHWTIYSHWQVDAALSRSLETMVGARYEDCCWSVSLLWRRWLRRDDNIIAVQTELQHDSGIFISFQLKGLAGTGSRIETMLESSIPGYNIEKY